MLDWIQMKWNSNDLWACKLLRKAGRFIWKSFDMFFWCGDSDVRFMEIYTCPMIGFLTSPFFFLLPIFISSKQVQPQCTRMWTRFTLAHIISPHAWDHTNALDPSSTCRPVLKDSSAFFHRWSLFHLYNNRKNDLPRPYPGHQLETFRQLLQMPAANIFHSPRGGN